MNVQRAIAAGTQAGNSILIVEDEMLVAMDLEYILTNAGHHVVGIAGDRAAVGTISDGIGEKPQIALVDLNLKDGPTGRNVAFDLAEKSDVAIIFITANPAQIGKPPIGAIGYVQKPFSDDAILAAVDFARCGTSRRAAHGLCLF